MIQRILIMGLPGAGKTYLAQHIVDHLHERVWNLTIWGKD